MTVPETSAAETTAPRRRRVELMSLFLCFILVLIFYYPSLLSSSKDAGYLYTGDIVGFYAPMIMKVHSLVRHLQLTGLDFSLYNGSSDFFLSPNFFTFHPIVILYSLLTPSSADSVQSVGQLITLMMVLHTFLALYFAQRLFRRFLGFDFPVALFGGALYAFSIHMVHALGQPPFFFVATVLPWICCAALENARRPTLFQTMLSSVPVVLALVGGYIPLGLGALGFAAIVVGAHLAFTHHAEQLRTGDTVRRALYATAPFIIGLGVCSLYILSLYLFNRETASGDVISLFYSAHQLAEAPSGLLRSISEQWHVPGPSFEFSVTAGLVPITIALVFIFSQRSATALARHELATLKVAGGLYFIGVLAIFGVYSVVGDMVYYFVPQVGTMHIYQRFLLFGHLAFAAMIALMLNAVVKTRPPVTLRIVLAALILATLVAAYSVAYDAKLMPSLGLSPHFVIELLTAALVVGALLIPGRVFVFVAATAFAVMPAVDRMYELSQYGNTFEKQSERQSLYLKPAESLAVANYIKQHTTKTYVKYIDITPMWTPEGVESFPKVFPYLLLDELNLSSYGGFTFYLSSRAEYRSRMPVEGDVRVRPDWGLLQEAGVDFVVVKTEEAGQGALASMLAGVPAGDRYPLPNGVVMIPVKIALDAVEQERLVFDNGMLRVRTGTPPTSSVPNLALHAAARQSSAMSSAELAVDGNHDGNFSAGSVSHTGQDLNAWFEIDLGASQPIGSVRIWNRTDCCQSRMDNYWIFISDVPFGEQDTAAFLAARESTWSKQSFAPGTNALISAAGTKGRYVRVQLPGNSPADSAYLHLAEVEVFPPVATQEIGSSADNKNNKIASFSANFANSMRAEIDLAVAGTVQYLFSDNPRLAYKVDGETVKFDTTSGVPTYSLPAGRHVVEISYSHPMLFLFWIAYIAYWLVIVATLVLLGSSRPAFGLLQRIRNRGITRVDDE